VIVAVACLLACVAGAVTAVVVWAHWTRLADAERVAELEGDEG
jgi:cell division protein FtsL